VLLWPEATEEEEERAQRVLGLTQSVPYTTKNDPVMTTSYK